MDTVLLYNAPNKEMAEQELKRFALKWNLKYPYAVQSWQKKGQELIVFFDFPPEIRKIIYTTNLIENLNGKIRTAKHIMNTYEKKYKTKSKVY